ncbi:FlgD immunoglobulin-like domain containing protein, partial [Candidatus Omnitrophota bacterium]
EYNKLFGLTSFRFLSPFLASFSFFLFYYRDNMCKTIINTTILIALVLPQSAGAWHKIIKTSGGNTFFDSAFSWVSSDVHKKIKYRLKVKTTGPEDGGWSVAHTYIYGMNVKQTRLFEIVSIQCQSEEYLKNEGDTGEVELELDDWYKIRLEVHADVKAYTSGKGDPGGSYTFSEAKIQFFEGESDMSLPSVDLMSPNGGEQLFTGESTAISWGAENLRYITLDYSGDGGDTWHLIERDYDAGSSYYEWNAPEEESENYLIRLTGENSGVSDQSDAYFTVHSRAALNTFENTGFMLLPNYPNPFNQSTQINFMLPSSGFTTLIIYNIAGRKIRELSTEMMQKGNHSVMWDGYDESGKAVSAGVYLSRLQRGAAVESGRMLLLK